MDSSHEGADGAMPLQNFWARTAPVNAAMKYVYVYAKFQARMRPKLKSRHIKFNKKGHKPFTLHKQQILQIQ